MEELLSIAEVGRLLRVSRQAIHKRIRSKQLKAVKIGRNYVIHRDEVRKALGEIIGEETKREINKAIKKAVTEYRGAFKKLGKE